MICSCLRACVCAWWEQGRCFFRGRSDSRVLSVPSRSCWSAFRSHPPEVKTWSPVDKCKHEANDFLQPEYIQLFCFIFLLQFTFSKDKKMLPLASLTPSSGPRKHLLSMVGLVVPPSSLLEFPSLPLTSVVSTCPHSCTPAFAAGAVPKTRAHPDIKALLKDSLTIFTRQGFSSVFPWVRSGAGLSAMMLFPKRSLI